MKKYEFTKETILVDGHILHRIKALIDIDARNVKVGDIGGFIEKEENLSHNDFCWVDDNACVYGNALVCKNAYIAGDAQVYGNAIVSDFVRVHGAAQVYGHADLSGIATVFGNSKVCGISKINDKTEIFNDTVICDNIVSLNNASDHGIGIVVTKIDQFTYRVKIPKEVPNKTSVTIEIS